MASRFSAALAATLAMALSLTALGDAETPPDRTRMCPDSNRGFDPMLVDSDLSEKLLGLSRGQILVVGCGPCRIRLLEACKLEGGYGFTRTDRTRLSDYLMNRADLFSKLPFDAPGLDSALLGGGTLSVGRAQVGFYETPVKGADIGALRGDCQGATHFVKKFEMGAFTLQRKTPGRADAAVTEMAKSGVIERCLISTTDAQSPVCSAVLKLYLVPLERVSDVPASDPHPLLDQTPGPSRARRLEASALGQSLILPTAGKTTIIVFWSAASAESIAMLKTVDRLLGSLDQQRVQAFGVTLDENLLAARNALAAHQLTLPLLLGDRSLARRYQATGNGAEVFVVDRQGRLRFYAQGAAGDPDRVEKAIRALAGK